MAKPYIVKQRKACQLVASVVDRKTGRLMGRVGQHYGGTNRDGWWTAWAPWPEWRNGLGESEARTQHEAIHELYKPGELVPPAPRRKCGKCRPVLNGTPCENCETQAAATARSRREHPIWWEHYDWLISADHPS